MQDKTKTGLTTSLLVPSLIIIIWNGYWRVVVRSVNNFFQSQLDTRHVAVKALQTTSRHSRAKVASGIAFWEVSISDLYIITRVPEMTIGGTPRINSSHTICTAYASTCSLPPLFLFCLTALYGWSVEFCRLLLHWGIVTVDGVVLGVQVAA